MVGCGWWWVVHTVVCVCFFFFFLRSGLACVGRRVGCGEDLIYELWGDVVEHLQLLAGELGQHVGCQIDPLVCRPSHPNTHTVKLSCRQQRDVCVCSSSTHNISF